MRRWDLPRRCWSHIKTGESGRSAVILPVQPILQRQCVWTILGWHLREIERAFGVLRRESPTRPRKKVLQSTGGGHGERGAAAADAVVLVDTVFGDCQTA